MCQARLAHLTRAGYSFTPAKTLSFPRSAGLFAPSLLWIVEAAEKRGDAAGALDDVARIYRNRLARATDRASVVITPAAELLVGLAVFLLAYAFLAPLMDMTRRLFTLQ